MRVLVFSSCVLLEYTYSFTSTDISGNTYPPAKQLTLVVIADPFWSSTCHPSNTGLTLLPSGCHILSPFITYNIYFERKLYITLINKYYTKYLFRFSYLSIRPLFWCCFHVVKNVFRKDRKSFFFTRTKLWTSNARDVRFESQSENWLFLLEVFSPYFKTSK
jgi:hypothetical protein